MTRIRYSTPGSAAPNPFTTFSPDRASCTGTVPIVVKVDPLPNGSTMIAMTAPAVAVATKFEVRVVTRWPAAMLRSRPG